jgi:hypothetical protein
MNFWKLLGIGAAITASAVDTKDHKTQEALGHIDKVISVLKPVSDAGLINDPKVAESVDFLHTLVKELRKPQ